jgi:hypothetical protein
VHLVCPAPQEGGPDALRALWPCCAKGGGGHSEDLGRTLLVVTASHRADVPEGAALLQGMQCNGRTFCSRRWIQCTACPSGSAVQGGEGEGSGDL